MKRILLLLALAMVILAGCVEKEPSIEELKTMMIDASQNVVTNRFTIVMEQDMTILNLTETNETLRAISINTKSYGDAELNLSEKAMKMLMTTTTSSKDNENVTISIEMYILGDEMYMKLDDNWIKMPGVSEEMFGQQNQLMMQMEMLNNSQIELMGSEKIDGQATYRLKMIPDMNTFSLILEKQMESMSFGPINLTDIYNNSYMVVETWISKDTNLPLKNQVYMTLTLTPVQLGLPFEEVGDIEMVVESNSTILFYDYNQPVEIELPLEARNATTMTTFMEMSTGDL
jgi:hypothetical protein